jgi:4-hydroxybenzoate polyprenyltransferase
MMDSPAPTRRLPPILQALRPYQWAKNLLLFVPLAMSHQLRDGPKLRATALGFVAFCLVASAGYIVNDLRDVDNDRLHPRKKSRPFASGRLPVTTGLIMIAIMLLAAFGLSPSLLGQKFAGLLGLYLLVALLYSFDLKRRLLVDVITLAGLYTLRLLAGGAASNVDVSPWLMALSMFLFLSLAFVKRYAELVQRDGGEQLDGRNYTPTDLGVIESVGPVSGYMAVLVLALYINSDMSQKLYRHPQLLLLVCPVMLYWITRVWFLARRKQLLDDPLLFALTDRISWLAGAVTVLVAWVAT